MNTLLRSTVIGMSSLLVLSGCGSQKDSARCDHAQPKTFNIKITAGSNKNKPPKVDKETLVACFQDDIVFEGNVDDFTISFKDQSPFSKNLGSSQGKAIGKVSANPKGKPIKFKYDVIVPGYPPLDPFLIIKSR